jgi:hypothetical protein
MVLQVLNTRHSDYMVQLIQWIIRENCTRTLREGVRRDTLFPWRTLQIVHSRTAPWLWFSLCAVHHTNFFLKSDYVISDSYIVSWSYRMPCSVQGGCYGYFRCSFHVEWYVFINDYTTTYSSLQLINNHKRYYESFFPTQASELKTSWSV